MSATNKLASVAKEDGCLYSGPTSITFDGTNAAGVGQYIVDSPETPLTTVGGVIEDSNNDLLKNSNACVPQTAGQPVQLPNNGVILVQTAASCTKALDSATKMVGNYWGSTGSQACEGNAIVGDKTYNSGGSSVGLSGSLTVAAANDVIIDNSITYDDCGTTPPGNNKASSCQISSTANDILGLIASNFIDLNHPLSSGGGNAPPAAPEAVWAATCPIPASMRSYSPCSTTSPSTTISTATRSGPSTTTGPWTSTSPTSKVDGRRTTTGYINNYDWDQRLAIISPRTTSHLAPACGGGLGCHQLRNQIGVRARREPVATVAEGAEWPYEPVTIPESPDEAAVSPSPPRELAAQARLTPKGHRHVSETLQASGRLRSTRMGPRPGPPCWAPSSPRSAHGARGAQSDPPRWPVGWPVSGVGLRGGRDRHGFALICSPDL